MSVPPTIDPPALPDRRTRIGRPPRRTIDPTLAAWPLGLVALLVAIGAWRAGQDEPARATPPEAAATAQRAFGELRLAVPRSWRTLERTDERVTWGAADRRHTVTLAGTESSALPLMAVVREVARQSADALPGVRVIDGPTLVDADDRLRRGDSLVLLRLRVEDDAGALDVVQTWRRDARAGRDVVATWTSDDGAWPVSPRDSIPSAGS